jgi:hypothetical protein
MLKLGVAAALGTCLLAAPMVATGGAAHAAAAGCLSTYGKVAIPGQTANWRIIESTAPSFGAGAGALTASAVSGPSNLWVFPGCGEALHYKGGIWRAAPLPAGVSANIFTTAASSPSDVWAFTWTAQALFWNGRTWAQDGQLTGVTSPEIDSAAAAGPDNVWATDDTRDHSLWHFNGQDWTRSSAPFSPTALSTVPGSSLWAAGYDKSTPVLAHLTGRSWTLYPMSRILAGVANRMCSPDIAAVSAQGPGSVWAIAGSTCSDNASTVLYAVLHWNGSSWTALALRGDPGAVSSIAPDGSGGLWISTQFGVDGQAGGAHGGMLHLTGGRIAWSPLPSVDGSHGEVLDAAPGGDGPPFVVGTYTVWPGNKNYSGSFVIEQR